MRNPARQGRPDANHGEIRKYYEDLYCSVVDSHELGGGFGDLIIGCSGLTEITEVKTADGEILPSQQTFRKSWRGSKIVIARNLQDVVDHVQRMRAKQARI